ncbi:MAG: uroporphyrinogen-III C-methyltransferase [Acidobacteriota bacterium]|nr:uroporphyrinogen-III C-methyltransferase [Acidobacteriota bacterium]
MSLLPLFLKLDNRPGLLVGAGNVALEKVGSLMTTGVRLHVVSPEIRPEIRQLAREGRLTITERAFDPADLDGKFVVIAATDNPAVNAEVYRLATERGILCNSADDPPHCDFYFGSIVRRGELQIAISTAGESPAVAQRLRREIDQQLPADLGVWLTELGALRREVLAIHPAGEARKALLHELAHRQICDSPLCATRQLGHTPTESGKVYLVGAGPGDPDLLTVKAVRLIQSAHVILHDDLVTDAILALAFPSAEIENVGKRCGKKNITQDEINTLMIDHARSGRSVVRLKSGDPLIFGRAAEEMAALDEAGIPHEVVPGITAAFAAAASLGCSLTSRHAASNLTFSSGHHAQSHNNAPVPEKEDATRVVYMPGRDLNLLALEWLNEGLPPEFPCAIVSRAAQPEQFVFHTTLGELQSAPQVAAPSLLIAGWALRDAAQQTVATALRSTIAN